LRTWIWPASYFPPLDSGSPFVAMIPLENSARTNAEDAPRHNL
jgi:hypothetical protein